jgi:outer membrane lipoprotein-sorting protein
MIRSRITGLVAGCLLCVTGYGQQSTPEELFHKIRAKLDVVKDYVADVKMKIDVSYMRVPMLRGKLYFKAPDKLKLERNGGISILPKKSISLTANSLIPNGNATVIDAGYDTVQNRRTHVIKIVPDDDGNEIVLTRVWVDEERMLALRTETTTRDNGTVKMELEFNKYINLSLPDRITFYLDVKDYKLPKGVTMDYDNGDSPLKKAGNGKPKKGKIQITYLDYKVNTGLPDSIFIEKTK